ncbi:MAG TPA: acyl-CoA dehydrogenase family protein [Gammaproteobacteria bacterium]|jgi:glutaryl-CoA dehydrogenase
MPAADSLDLYDREALLGDEERLIRNSVATFVDREVLPVIGRCFAEHRFPAELMPGMAELGLFGATLRGYGCAGVSNVGYGLICEELERGDSALRSFVSVQTSLVMSCIDSFGTAAQKERWLGAMARGESIGCFGLTEPQGGSDPGNMRTTATRSGSDWRLNGGKQWITNGGIADVAIIWARTEQGIAAFLVEAEARGFTRKTIEDKLSLRASNTAELFLDDVGVPDEARLPEAIGLKAALTCLDRARYGIAWGALGAARACLAEALAFTAERTLFGRKLAETQSIQVRLANCARKLTAAQLLALRLGELKEEGAASPAQISLAKWNNVDTALEIARECRDMLGAAGITTEHCSMRHMLNLETVATYEGTRTIHELVVGRLLTGHAAF